MYDCTCLLSLTYTHRAQFTGTTRKRVRPFIVTRNIGGIAHSYYTVTVESREVGKISVHIRRHAVYLRQLILSKSRRVYLYMVHTLDR